MDTWPQFQGSIKPLKTISPTRFTGLADCALREVWLASGNHSLLPSSPAARAGIVSHRLLAEAGQGHLESVKAVVGSRWNELLDQTEAEMRRSPIERHLQPLSKSVPDLEVRRLRAVQRALELSSTASQSRRIQSTPGKASPFGFELRVQSTDGLVRGVIDAALPTNEGPLIQDYKSGAIFDAGRVAAPKLKETYQTQLRMYAALYADAFAEWPSKLELVPLSGESYEVPFNRQDCTALVVRARQALQRLNETISTAPEERVPSLLAKPSPESCRYCPYRPACQPYWAARTTSGEDGWPLDVRGVVQEIRKLGNSKMLLKLRTDEGIASIPGLSCGERHPALLTVEVGDKVAVFNLMRARASQSYSETPLTTIYYLNGGPQVRN